MTAPTFHPGPIEWGGCRVCGKVRKDGPPPYDVCKNCVRIMESFCREVLRVMPTIIAPQSAEDDE